MLRIIQYSCDKRALYPHFSAKRAYLRHKRLQSFPFRIPLKALAGAASESVLFSFLQGSS